MNRRMVDLRYDATSPFFTPWWERCSSSHFEWQLGRYKRALRFCKGRAADLHPILFKRIQWLEKVNDEPQGKAEDS